MKKLLILGVLGFACLHAQAAKNQTTDTIPLAQLCLSYAKTQFQQNPNVTYMLNQSRLNSDDVQENLFNNNVGKQSVSTEVVLDLHSKQEVFGTLLCLFDGRNPIYSFFAPIP
ncbi:hypothetical protein PTR91_15160 [Serratia bockelmannii]|uniref:hypothetical protein n=1 Tax=Serratia TaxID=613 RepID=UPI0028A6458A|nr:hypothetical protein [Serratia bockelmannii]